MLLLPVGGVVCTQSLIKDRPSALNKVLEQADISGCNYILINLYSGKILWSQAWAERFASISKRRNKLLLKIISGDLVIFTGATFTKSKFRVRQASKDM